MSDSIAPGTVYLVGAGPGDPGLLTVRGRALLERAEVVVADHLVAAPILALVPDGAELFVRGARRSGLDQSAINRLLVEKGRAGRMVVRLKGGDPFVFGRGAEEAEVLARAGVPWEVVPGVTSGVAVPAYAGIPVTHRGATGAVAFATGHERDDDSLSTGGAQHVAWEALARGATTLVLYMSLERLGESMRRLVLAGRAPSTPVAVISHGTRATQRTVVGTAADIAARVAEAKLAPPALTVVGDVVRERERLAWFEARPLHGARVLVTRALNQAEATAERLEALGAEVLVVPAIAIAPPASWASLDEAVARIERFKLLAATSANAVTSLFQRLDAAGRDARALAGLRVAAVGPATAAAFATHGVRADLVAASSTGEGLAAALAHLGPADGPALLPRAAEGRDVVEKALAARGLAVEAVPAYRTVPVAAERLAPAVSALAAGSIDAVLLGSPRTAAALLAALPSPRLLEAPLVGAIGPTTADWLAHHGVRVDVVAVPHTFSALCDALVGPLAERLASRSDGEPLG